MCTLQINQRCKKKGKENSICAPVEPPGGNWFHSKIRTKVKETFDIQYSSIFIFDTLDYNIEQWLCVREKKTLHLSKNVHVGDVSLLDIQ